MSCVQIERYYSEAGMGVHRQTEVVVSTISYNSITLQQRIFFFTDDQRTHHATESKMSFSSREEVDEVIAALQSARDEQWPQPAAIVAPVLQLDADSVKKAYTRSTAGPLPVSEGSEF